MYIRLELFDNGAPLFYQIAHTADVKRAIWHPNLDIVASGSYDNKIKMFKEDDDDWICCATLTSHENTVWSLAFNHSGDR